jgi:hypothetical protein
MSRNPFGGSYPPGAASDPFAPYNAVDLACEVCGLDPLECECPECPDCGEIGRPACEKEHGHAALSTLGIVPPVYITNADRDVVTAWRRHYFLDLVTGKLRRYWPAHLDGMDRDLIEHGERHGSGVRPSWD